MQSVLFEDAKKQLDSLCEKTCQDHEPYIINRADHNHVVVMSLEDFNAWQETQYLLSTPANSERLLRSLASARSGKLTQHDLIEE
ncbi:MAG: type II toxin-antitoxin system prevent-host-death family antitoxin [Candidatus Methylumidiphilus alinenensis]|uniref:Antitoxin n=1 Tax=Candidatus Methylumidiphilus alinenensis TaxID=2202197 RepID=A0A2W4QNC3_9GAMM|nr:MAG: type II toxin-antitoxin system prevent-host-death family antitoxin [Candidatus Methylumidiphilus alinenensis]